ncbi:MAG TPA: hypothetical protein VNU47_02400 [Candidatus Paceibacterota bacterium]|nr:hypothetical protein [Candidatus Paceibacterota bacterium]
MYVVDVIALSPTSPSAPLSYRSKERLKAGTVVQMTLRKTPVFGIVVAATEIKDAKAMLKQASFALAKSITHTAGMLPGALMHAAERIADAHAVSLGSVLHALLSDSLKGSIPRVLPAGPGFTCKTYEYPRDTRLRKYRTRIEANTEQKRATLLIVPTTAELNELKAAFKEFSPIVLSGEVKPDKREDAIRACEDARSLILATPAFSFIAIRALGEIIIERPSAGTYRMPRRPHLDWITALKILAEERAVVFTLGDYPLPLEHRPKPEAVLSQAPPGTAEAIDVRALRAQGEVWRAVPDALAKEIQSVLKEHKRVLVLAARKGYAPSIACRDCGTTLKSEFGTTYSLATVNGVRVLRTADGRTLASPETVCPNCGSWNLQPLGVGIERVMEELKEAFPDEHLARFDSDTVKTDTAARKAMKLYREKRGILVATETVLPWLGTFDEPDDIALAVVASMDSLLSLPFWRARERFARIGLMLRTYAARVLIGTRLPDDAALSAILDPEHTGFFEEEASLRKILAYPPYGTIIAIQVEGTRKRLLEAKIAVLSAVLPFAPVPLPERMLEKNLFRLTLLLPLPEGAWPEKSLSQKLQALPPYARVLVDPESFW